MKKLSVDKNTPQGKGFRSAYQAIAGTVVAFFTGLWAIPEVQEFVAEFTRTEGVELLLGLLALAGVSTGLIAFAQNRLGR